MSDDVLTIESSTELSSPRELITITHGTTTYRITTATRDILHDGEIYTATAAARGEIGVDASGSSSKELTLTLPIDHALVRRYLKQANPPGLITVVLKRKYHPTEHIETIFTGEITSLSVDDEGTEASFTVLSRLALNLLRVLPNVPAERTCSHTLYGTLCRVDRDDPLFKVTTSVMYVNGRDVRLDIGSTSADGWSDGGELIHVASGERMTIRKQTYVGLPSSVVTLSLQLPMVDLKIGDSVIVQAGCNRTIEQCVSRFDNRVNFGGFPQLPISNPFVVESTGAEGD